jgi:hypothetical protein
MADKKNGGPARHKSGGQGQIFALDVFRNQTFAIAPIPSSLPFYYELKSTLCSM